MAKSKVGMLPLLLALLAIVSLGLVAYGFLVSHVVDSMASADQLEKDGMAEEALAEYRGLVDFLNTLPLLRSRFEPEYSGAMVGQLRMLYPLERYDEAIEVADICIQEDVEDLAAAYFWSGNAYVQKGVNENSVEDQAAWLNRARDQYKKALENDTGQRWNIRYNYELVRTVLEQQQEEQEDQPVKILRPKDQIQQADTRVIG